MTTVAAARVPGGDLSEAYRHCRGVAAAHGRTYFLATRLLSAERRPAVHALYAFARTVDDIVDHEIAPGTTDSAAVARLDRIEAQLRARLDRCGPVDPDPVLAAVADTITRYDIAPQHFWVFLDAMRMDVPGSARFRNRYRTMAELRDYMRGSAAAIGLQMLPVLGTVVPVAEAEPAAAALGEAFQLTNFLRDVAEDLDRDRIYLPATELAAFGVDEDLLRHCRRTGHTDPRLRRALAHLIATNRALYRIADPGIALLHPRVRPAIHTAALLYAAILDEIEHAGYEIFTRRVVVPGHRRLRVAATHLPAALTG
ncbi:phytoene/squalene synthase family protein [Nocardia macrotermitis]|uniref:All-trans-phytoene synthase n=1 Tax=Nocardia macrotermitis TaxID=2585198 RepID=A0A7K0D6X6_9NOCA|nr:phytoene/squalene synthase family protein [Nocardia macrotermitis]MQY21311.1 All-trans-phytoene synthase [Nocardia macrotermitis]